MTKDLAVRTSYWHIALPFVFLDHRIHGAILAGRNHSGLKVLGRDYVRIWHTFFRSCRGSGCRYWRQIVFMVCHYPIPQACPEGYYYYFLAYFRRFNTLVRQIDSGWDYHLHSFLFLQNPIDFLCKINYPIFQHRNRGPLHLTQYLKRNRCHHFS